VKSGKVKGVKGQIGGLGIGEGGLKAEMENLERELVAICDQFTGRFWSLEGYGFEVADCDFKSGRTWGMGALSGEMYFLVVEKGEFWSSLPQRPVRARLYRPRGFCPWPLLFCSDSSQARTSGSDSFPR